LGCRYHIFCASGVDILKRVFPDLADNAGQMNDRLHAFDPVRQGGRIQHVARVDLDAVL
jgi:hypothetical protein